MDFGLYISFRYVSEGKESKKLYNRSNTLNTLNTSNEITIIIVKNKEL
jgi:hypothetical protein